MEETLDPLPVSPSFAAIQDYSGVAAEAAFLMGHHTRFLEEGPEAEGASYPETARAGVEEEGVVDLSYATANFVPPTADQVCIAVVARPL